MVRFFVNFLDVLYLKLYDFMDPIRKTTSRLYLRQLYIKCISYGYSGFKGGKCGCFLLINKWHPWGQSALRAIRMLALSVQYVQIEFCELFLLTIWVRRKLNFESKNILLWTGHKVWACSCCCSSRSRLLSNKPKVTNLSRGRNGIKWKGIVVTKHMKNIGQWGCFETSFDSTGLIT